MGEGPSDTMNLDLNLGPGPEAGSGSVPSEGLNLDEWVDNPFDRIREAVRRRRWRWQQVRIPSVPHMSVELDQLMGDSPNLGTLQAGEGSVAAGERMDGESKTCENISGYLETEVSESKDDVVKGGMNDGSFFDCNICLDLARDPVVTCCGHLFCWSCVYQWLNVHSDAKECPVCKGEVTVKTVIPIYGRGDVSGESEEVADLKIPLRPNAQRVESLRQFVQRNAFSLPVEEMIRHLGARPDLSRDLTLPRDTASSPQETTGRISSLVHRILTSRGIREEQSTDIALNEVEVMPAVTESAEGATSRIHYSLLLQRQTNLRRAARLSSLSTALSSAERLVDAYFRTHPAGRNQEQPPAVVDRDSFSSIAAVINSENQMDTAMEIDSVVSLSTSSSSRRRHDSSRMSDIDSGDSRAPRRRRLS